MGIARLFLNKAWNRFAVPLVLILLTSAGCHSPGRGRIVSQAAVDDSTRSSFGRVGLLVTEHDAGFGFRHPLNTKHAIGNAAVKTWDTLNSSDDDSGLEEFAFSLIVSALSGVFGGLATGVPQAEIDAAEKQLSLVLEERPLLPGISNRLQFVLQKRGSPPLVEIPAVIAAELNAVVSEDRDYRPLTVIGVDTLVEIRIDQHSFEAEERANPPMTAEAKARVDITRVSDGALLFSDSIHYRRHQHRFTEWADDDARRFRSELRRTERVIGRSIADQVFVPTRTDSN